jgi:hypothetical protein
MDATRIDLLSICRAAGWTEVSFPRPKYGNYRCCCAIVLALLEQRNPGAQSNRGLFESASFKRSSVTTDLMSATGHNIAGARMPATIHQRNEAGRFGALSAEKRSW